MISREQIIANFESEFARLKDPKDQLKEIVTFATTYGDSWGDKMIPILERGIEISRKIDFLPGEVICYFNLNFLGGIIQGSALNSKYKIENFSPEELLDQIKYDKYYYTMGLNLLGYYYWFRGEYEKGFNSLFKSLKILENNDNPLWIAWNFYALGVFYFDTKDFTSSLNYYQKANDNFKKVSYDYGMARSSNGIASVHIVANEAPKAVPHLEFAVGVYRKLGHHAGLSRSLNDMGMLEKSSANYPAAIKHLNESIALRKELNHIQGLITSYTEIAEIYLTTEKNDEALENLNEALKLCHFARAMQKEVRVHKLLSDLYKKTGEIALALDHFEKFYDLKTKLMSDESANSIKRLQTQFATEKSEKEAEIHRLKNIELKTAYQEIADKNKEILDSINYARLIQRTILPDDAEVNEYLPKSFILYQPKDVVSGDFYWLSHKAGKTFVAAIDCTGHGVPGAFMSMIGNTLLNEIVNEKGINRVDEILFHLREGVIRSLKQTGAVGENKDGMDISLICIEGTTICFAGANNPLWIFSKEGFKEIKADKQPIGIYSGEPRPFTNHEVKLSKGDTVYLFTDGYADQFGGPLGKKFKYKQMQELIQSNIGKSMGEQKVVLENTLAEWMGSLEQVDDVCIIGIRL